MIIDITIAAPNTAVVERLYALNSGNNSLVFRLTDEDNNTGALLASVGAAASNSLQIPSIGSAASAAGNIMETLGFTVGPGEKLTSLQTGAGAQNDTMTVNVALLLPITASSTDITWSVARSTNPGSVTLADSTISDANAWVAVRMP